MQGINLKQQKNLSMKLKTHNNKYNYSKTIYKSSKKDVIIICKKHGEFTTNAYGHIKGVGCQICSISKEQYQLTEFIRSLNFNIKSNDRKIIVPYELDIWIKSHNLAIEFNGNFYHSYNRIETTKERNKHKHKADLTHEKEISLLQIASHEWNNNKNLIKSMIKHRLGLSNRIYARKCTIQKIDNKITSKFFTVSHISGHRHAKIAYGLYYNDELVSAINFNPIKNNYEIIRYASLPGLTIVGGLSKLLTRFIKDHKPNSIMTFVDRRYGNGIGYKKFGFELMSITKPGYIYLHSNCQPAGSRIKFQKHKLQNKLKLFDPLLTEAQNMFNNKYRRMWDAGHYKLIRHL